MNTLARLLSVTAVPLAAAAIAALPAHAIPMPTPTPSPTSGTPMTTAGAPMSAGVPMSAATASARQATIAYTCAAPLGTGTATPMQVMATIPATAAVGQPLAVQWNLTTGLRAPEAIAANTALHKGVLKVIGGAPAEIITSSAGNPAAIGTGQPLALPAMQASYTPTQAGTLTLMAGDVSVLLTRGGIAQETRCSADPAAAPLASVSVSANGVTGGAPAAAPAPTVTVTVTVTATPTPDKKSKAARPQTAITPKGGAPTGGGGLAGANPWPYAGLGVGVLFAAGLGWELRRKRIHGY
ncbi:hypothetical protein HS041_29600 [Planomonospora sp. ID67723]|uniref:hypothetical protein n=1 Tax=Planomonospora sp. ID67723 TaxID=2738134 RepID=UPI0018C35C2B|nr:hypothetical protein [Planomonospora sp. ID67723]MBG0831869.1 hypothetical protein [Planomonospora sp. ID67723]